MRLDTKIDVIIVCFHGLLMVSLSPSLTYLFFIVFYRVINILLGKGYIELEETLLQWKQKAHLMARLEVIRTYK